MGEHDVLLCNSMQPSRLHGVRKMICSIAATTGSSHSSCRNLTDAFPLDSYNALAPQRKLAWPFLRHRYTHARRPKAQC